MVNILLVEDDKSFGYILSEYMLLKNYSVTWSENVTDAIKNLKKDTFDMVILDINLKNESGFDVAELLSTEYPKLPFIFLTARDLKIDQLKGYRLGAEEFITKPIDEEILMAKIEAIVNRNKKFSNSNKLLEFKEARLDILKRELIVNGKSAQLTERESLLMKALLEKPQQLVSRKRVLQDLWENQDEFSRNSMDVYISRLRKYLSDSSLSIRNVHGKGFVLE